MLTSGSENQVVDSGLCRSHVRSLSGLALRFTARLTARASVQIKIQSDHYSICYHSLLERLYSAIPVQSSKPYLLSKFVFQSFVFTATTASGHLTHPRAIPQWVPTTTKSRLRIWLGTRKRGSTTTHARAEIVSKSRGNSSRITKISRHVRAAASSSALYTIRCVLPYSMYSGNVLTRR